MGVKKNSRSLLLILIILTSFINPFLGASINVALPAIAEEFSLGALSLSWVAMAFLLSSAVFLLPLGKVADIWGRKKIFLYGNLLIALSSLACGLATTGLMLIVFRGVQGVGSAMVFGTGIAIVTSAYPPHRRGWAIGLTVTSVYLGLTVAPFLGGLLTEYLGWRSIFFLTIPFELAVVLGTLLFIREEWADASGEAFDLRGSLVYVLSMWALMFGFSKFPDTSGVLLAGAGVTGLILFVWLELRTKSPVFEIGLFRSNRLFAFSNLAALINYATTFGITFLLSLFLQFGKGLSPGDAGLILVTQPAVMALVASLSGRLSDTYDPRILASLGMAITVAGLVLLIFLSASTGTLYLVLTLAVVGTGFGMFSSPNTNAIMGSVERKYLGIASATVGTMRLTGQMFSMGIATLILQMFIGNDIISDQNISHFLASMRSTFIIFAILCFLGVFASLARGKRKEAISADTAS